MTSDEGGHSNRLGVPYESPLPAAPQIPEAFVPSQQPSRLSRRLEFLGFPQGERFLWLGLCRSGIRCGHLGLMNGGNGGGGPGLGSRRDFLFDIPWRLEQLPSSTRQDFRRDFGCETRVCGSSERRSLLNFDEMIGDA